MKRLVTSDALGAEPSAAGRTVDTKHILSSTQTTCCVVGAGPAGAILALLLARQGVPVLLLEAHKDFDRDFRGNTINPAIMRVLDQLGLVEQLLQLPHAKIRSFTAYAADGPLTFADFSQLPTTHPYVTMLPQSIFLEFITAEAKRYPHFKLVMGARVEALMEANGIVEGVHYRDDVGQHEVRARLTIGADGRFSRLRRLAEMEPVATAPAMDVLWFRLPRHSADDQETGAHFRFGCGSLVVLMDHIDHWQVGYIIRKGSYPEVRAAGLPALWAAVAKVCPELADRVEHVRDWKDIALLSVESSCLRRWFRPGLLLIGDAAHVMSPIGGVGINCAIQDAVVAANILAAPLREGRLRMRHLRMVQRQRALPTRIVQAAQAFAQRWGVAEALNSSEPFQVPTFLRIALKLPVIRTVPAWLIAFGVWPVYLRL